MTEDASQRISRTKPLVVSDLLVQQRFGRLVIPGFYNTLEWLEGGVRMDRRNSINCSTPF